MLHLDNHLIALAKPAGLPSVPDDSGDLSLLDQAKDWIAREFNKPGKVFLGVVHRLDRPVSGVLLFARTSKAASRLSEQFRSVAAKKTYLAIGAGALTGAGELTQWLLKDAATNRSRVVDEQVTGAKCARTDWRVLASSGGARCSNSGPRRGARTSCVSPRRVLACPCSGI